MVFIDTTSYTINTTPGTLTYLIMRHPIHTRTSILSFLQDVVTSVRIGLKHKATYVSLLEKPNSYGFSSSLTHGIRINGCIIYE